MLYIRLFLFYLLLLSSSVSGGTIEPSTSDSKYLEFGSQFYCITKICGTYNDETKFCASAVIIDKNHILTAAHVVKGYKVCNISLDDKTFALDKVIIHEDFEKNFGSADIAIAYSKKDFGLKYYPPMYEASDEVGKVCSISGYGLTGTFNTGAKTHDDKKRAGSNTIDSIDSNLLICSPSKRGDKDYTVLEYMIASGDSGGGLFIEGKLAGINSCIMRTGKGSPSSRYGDESGHTRVSRFIEWINKNKTR